MEEDLGHRHSKVRREKSCRAVYSVPNGAPAPILFKPSAIHKLVRSAQVISREAVTNLTKAEE